MRKKITIDQLIPGMYVVSTNRSWLQLPFFRKKIRDDRAVDKLREHLVTELVIDTERGLDTDGQGGPANPFEFPEVLASNLAQSSQLHREVINKTAELMDWVGEGKVIDQEMVDEPVNMMIDQILEDPQSMLCVSVLKNTDEYTFNHCVNVSILALFLAKSVGLSRDKMLILGKGALLHDIGKCMVPREIIEKPGRLEDDEAEVVRTHVERGLRYLAKMKDMPKEVFDFVRDHHERIDGSGYPRGLKGDAISWYGRVGAVLDVYDSLIHENYYKGAMDPLSVLDSMREKVGSLYDPRAFNALADCLGAHPPGTILMLDTGEIAISFEPNYNNPNRPKILLMTKEDGTFHDHPVPVDLEACREGTATHLRTILSPMTQDEIPFDPFEILGNFSLQGTDLG